ncbi:MAG: winged helix-turn-helix transcriptional regulator [Kiritimatiellaeota bacterium]|nr:winged helix-turn-helix transcriptional regulator [Kiritimatiellota bacterium]
MRKILAVTKAFADENRLRILAALEHGERCVCEITELLELAPATVSKHLSQLYHAGLVDSRKEGRWVYYRLADEDPSPAARDAIAWILNSLRDDPVVRSDAERLAQIDRTEKALPPCPVPPRG